MRKSLFRIRQFARFGLGEDRSRLRGGKRRRLSGCRLADAVWGKQPQTLIDQSYSFDAQKYVMQTPEVVTQAGGQYTITCSYFNPTPENVLFGESTTDEMCFALTMVYPVQPSDECTK